MVIATRINTTLTSGFTQATLGDFIKQGMLNAGFSAAVDDYTSGSDRLLVFSHVIDAAKTYGTTFIKLRISSSLNFYHQALASWNTSTKAGTYAGTEAPSSSTAINSGNLLNITALNGGSEYKLICMYQGSNAWYSGLLIPEKRPTWWDLNSFNYGFVPANFTNLNTWRTTVLNPHSSTIYDASLAYTQMATANPVTNKRDVMTGLLLYTQSNSGIAAKTSDDLVQMAASGVARNEIVQSGTNKYLTFCPGVGALGVRIE